MGIDCEGLSKLVDVGIYSKDKLIAIQDDKIKETADKAEIDETYLRKLWEEAKGLKISAVDALPEVIQIYFCQTSGFVLIVWMFLKDVYGGHRAEDWFGSAYREGF